MYKETRRGDLITLSPNEEWMRICGKFTCFGILIPTGCVKNADGTLMQAVQIEKSAGETDLNNS